MVKDYTAFFTATAEETQEVTAAAVVQDKIILSVRAVQQMEQFSVDAATFVGEHLGIVLKDWARAKGIAFELDKTINDEKEKVRKVLEGRIADINRDKSALAVVCAKHEERISALESTEKELAALLVNFKRCMSDLMAKQTTCEELELKVATLETDIDVRSKDQAAQAERIEELEATIAGLQKNVAELEVDIAQRLVDLADAQAHETEAYVERDHYQVRRYFVKYHFALVSWLHVATLNCSRN